MTTPYSRSISKGSQTFQGYVNAPILNPLNTSQYPNIIPKHNLGVLSGQRPTPPQFYSNQEPLYSDMSTNARVQYIRATYLNNKEQFKQNNLAKTEKHMNYIAPLPGSMYTNVKKSIAIGKSVYKVGLPLSAPISSKNYDTNVTNSARRRARSSGSVAPKKKGSIYNTSLTQSGINGWGSIPRQNY
jgi:hypothetical protein